MRRLVLLVVLLSSGLTYAQNTNELDKRNGFKDIKLLSDVTTYDNLEFWKHLKDEPDHDIYKNSRGSYKSVGDVEIHKITLLTYRNLIYQIEVVTSKDEKFFRSLEKAYGKIKYSVGGQVSFWEGADVKLTYVPDGKKLILTYTAKGINTIIAADKKKEVDSLSSEF